MANWSQSHFLQSLGWATLNSFWQMALLWCLFIGAGYFFKISSAKKYQLSVIAIVSGFAWFVFTFFYYYQSRPVSTLGLFDNNVSGSGSLLNIFLISASLTYLALLVFPAFKLFRNWQFVQRIRKHGLQKADFASRLFVQKISSRLGIRKKVMVYLSELVKSPVTVGYLKPVVLLPVAVMNHLSVQQVEAILLHELSHIRRYDYLVNFIISIISTVLYFNPFVKLFLRSIEEERENCCDQLVLQFGYDKVGYASALLSLEKISGLKPALVLGATGKNYLLQRIERIVGLEKKKGLKFHQLAGLLTALLCIVVFNSVLIIKEKKEKEHTIAYENLANPFNVFDIGEQATGKTILPVSNTKSWLATVPPRQAATPAPIVSTVSTVSTADNIDLATMNVPVESMFQYVAADEVDLSLTLAEKEKINTTVAATKKILNNLQWQEVENSIADAMNQKEKEMAKQQYLKALDEKVNWQRIEENMKAQYDKIDWQKINANVDKGLTMIRLDSLQKNYSEILVELSKAKTELCINATVSVNPMPDQSISEIQRSAEEVRRKVDSIKQLRNPKKIVKL